MSDGRRIANEIRKMCSEDAQIRRHNSILSDRERDINNHKAKIELMVRAMYRCLIESGVTREEIGLKIKQIEERGWTINPPGYYRICPKCGKKVFDYTDTAFEATCMYCGQRISMYPGDITE